MHPQMCRLSKFAAASAVILIFLVGTAAVEAREPIFLAAHPFDLQSVLPPPPAEDSAQEADELAELHRLEATRTASQEERAKLDDAEEDVFIFRTVVGQDFNAERLPAVAAFFAHVKNDASVFAKAGKVAWHRRRPVVVDPTLHPVGRGTSESYPSGHATLGWLDGILLAAMLPEKREAILSRAADYAHNRLVCGVHFRSDIEAGQVTATVASLLLRDSPQFQAEFKTAQQELQREHLTAAP
ncbi:phosphatase PAP2 family protein [Telmatospirillum sp.]|uniref:acid phosphatase n=1 Tax=Telmatospirillum sp. TaxID=2079197 RepID=UPI002845D3F2|nr:phosphatase PAP2 family protein [Telmatospirillum sp.]MDR3435209.1 phosphatase PAP2 family protein [Telmatospirillum sp.]